MSTTNKYTINGAGDWVLPENRLLQVFENHHNISIIDTDKRGPGDLGVIDSIHTRAYSDYDQRRDAIVALVKRNGGQPAAQIA